MDIELLTAMPCEHRCCPVWGEGSDAECVTRQEA